MHEMELRRKMKTAVVPTNDAEVRKALRQLGEPVTLFGEREVREGEWWWVGGSLLRRLTQEGAKPHSSERCRVWVQGERRDRLRKLLAAMPEEELEALGRLPEGGTGAAWGTLPASGAWLHLASRFVFAATAGDIEMGEAPPAPSELFYTEGEDDLRAARLEVGGALRWSCCGSATAH